MPHPAITSVSKTKTKKNGDFFPASTPSVLDLRAKALTKTQKQRRRSYLSAKLKKLGYHTDVRSRTILLAEQSLADIPVPARFYIREILRLGLTKQLTLFN